jgi:NAD(P)-dependent dehydrogenase (short-subunit alcohol dehydrogenase family)
MSKLVGKFAVVTGASRGIGAAIAKALAVEGAAVVVNYASRKADADAVVSAGGRAIAVKGDQSRSRGNRRVRRRSRLGIRENDRGEDPAWSCRPAGRLRRLGGVSGVRRRALANNSSPPAAYAEATA